MGQLTGCRETTDACPILRLQKPQPGVRTNQTKQAASRKNIGGKNNGNSNRKQYRWQGRCPLFQVQGSRPG